MFAILAVLIRTSKFWAEARCSYIFDKFEPQLFLNCSCFHHVIKLILVYYYSICLLFEALVLKKTVFLRGRVR